MGQALVVASAEYLDTVDEIVPMDGSWSLVSTSRALLSRAARNAQKVVFVFHHDGSDAADQAILDALLIAKPSLPSGALRAIYVGGPGAASALAYSSLLHPLPTGAEALANALREDFARAGTPQSTASKAKPATTHRVDGVSP
jgi:hypothetical protein